jgi:tRNA(fMet)-specific endonuclease VapC
MVILDTDHVSVLEWAGSPEGQRLWARLDQTPPNEVATTIISFEEQTRGWLTVLAQARSLAQQVEAYRRLNRQLDNFCRMIVLEFDERAAAEFQRLRNARVRVSTMDLKIAAVALTHQATLLTRNLRDFRQVPGLSVEDWTA